MINKSDYRKIKNNYSDYKTFHYKQSQKISDTGQDVQMYIHVITV
jgi:hypothetical protein